MIDPKDLEAYKFSLQQELEKFKYDRQCELEHYKEKMLRERHDWLFSQTGAVELMRGVISLALLSLRSLIVVNGGAVIAILTFSGNLFSRADCRAMAKAMSEPMTAFLAGLALALVASTVSYFAQVAFSELPRTPDGRHDPWGNRLRFTAVAAGGASLAAFSMGAIKAAGAFSGAAC